MPIVLGELPLRETTIDFGDAGTLTLRYRPPIGAEVARALALAQNSSEQPAEAFEALVDMIVSRVVEWDVVDGSGQPLPVSRETLLLLPVDWIVRIANAIQGEPREGG
jgi:hypothetical protein